MRIYTLVLSIVVHVLAVAGVWVTNVVATDELPAPRRASTFIVVQPIAPPSVPPPARREPAAANVSRDAAPLVAPEGVRPELPPAIEFPVPEAGSIDGLALNDVPSTAEVVPPPPPPPSVRAPVRVGGAIRPPTKIVHVAPDYPAIARASRVSGVVILEALIAGDGGVRDVRVLRSVPLLDEAAVRAVQQWRFTPTLLNGEPVPVVMTVTVAFTLN
jgi:protein TonB